MSDSNKKGFAFGLVTGIAVIAVIGFFVMMFMYIGNKDGGNKVVDNDQPKNEQNQPPVGGNTNIDIKDTDHVRGSMDAKVTVVEFSDFQCPYCSRFHETMNQLVKEFPNDVRWVYKHFPLDSLHPLARKAAEASECAADQGKFWEFSDVVFANQSKLSQSDLINIASNIGLETDSFESCLTSGKYAEKVEAEYQQGISSGVTGTPGNLINGQLVPGALPIENMRGIVEQILSQS